MVQENAAGMLMLFGLGNPGRSYEATRHNLGFRLADDLSRFCRIPLNETSRYAIYGRGRWNGQKLVIVKPLTFMNRSGMAVEELVRELECSARSILVACDDANLDLGRLRLRSQGSAGGQKGLQSIIKHLGSEDFARLRLGIGMAPDGIPLEDYVLDRFHPTEEETVEEMIWRARDTVLCVLESGVKAAMSRFNQKPDSPVETNEQKEIIE